MSAEDAAAHVLSTMQSRRFASFFPFRFSLIFRIGRLLPRRLFVRIL